MAALNLDAIESKGLPGIGVKNIGDVITTTLPYIYMMAAVALLIFLVSGGLQLMTAKGDPKAIQGAQGKITNALLGFIIVIVSIVIVRFIGELLGINIFSTLFG